MTEKLIRHARMWLLLAGAGLLAGCVYDPYTGSYYPCCSNPYPYYYGYPAYPPNISAPYGYQPPGYAPSGYPAPYYPPPAYTGPPYGYAPQAAPDSGEAALAQRFAAANVTRDGRLTLQQAEGANWEAVARNFPEIDIDRKGYVTLNEVRAWMATHQPPPGMPG